MFYCEKCREQHNYRKSIVKSQGRCEICGDTALCHDIIVTQIADESDQWWYCNVCGHKTKAKNMRIVFGELTCPTCARECGETGEPAYIG